LTHAAAELAWYGVEFLFAKGCQMTLAGNVCWKLEVAKETWIVERQ